MKSAILTALLSFALLGASAAGATGLATCDSGPRESWQPQEKLEKMLGERGWKIRRIKEDGGCYEVYAFEELHETLSNVLIGLVALHVAGVVFTSFRQRENLVGSMLHGTKRAAHGNDVV